MYGVIHLFEAHKTSARPQQPLIAVGLRQAEPHWRRGQMKGTRKLRLTDLLALASVVGTALAGICLIWGSVAMGFRHHFDPAYWRRRPVPFPVRMYQWGSFWLLISFGSRLALGFL